MNGSSFSALADAAATSRSIETWKQGDVIVAEFPMEPRRVVADQRVTQETGEGRDRTRTDCVLRGVARHRRQGAGSVLEPAAGLQSSADRSFSGDVTVIETRATRVTNPSLPAKPIRLIPYSLWANRGPGEMTVWLSTADYAMGDTGPPAASSSMKTRITPPTAGAISRPRRSTRAPARRGAASDAIPGARGTAVGNGQAKHRGHARGVRRARNRGARAVRHPGVNGVRGWFLPSRDELALMYRHLKAAGLGDFQDGGVPTTSPTGLHRNRRPTWRCTSISPILAGARRRQGLSSKGPRGPDDLTRARFKVRVFRPGQLHADLLYPFSSFLPEILSGAAA